MVDGSPPPAARRFRRRPAAIGVLVVAVAAAVAWWALRDDGERSSGPLRGDADESISFGQPVGRRFGYGQPLAFNNGDRPAVL